MRNIDESGFIIVKRSVSPLAYVGIIILSLVFAFVAMVVALNVINRDSYKTAEMNYLLSASNAFSSQPGSTAQTAEFELRLGLHPDFDLLGDYFTGINNTIFKGQMSVNDTDIDYIFDYFNGDKKVLSAVMSLKDNIMSFAFPEISETVFQASAEESVYGLNTELDVDALNGTIAKIIEKYFEMVGEPEIIDKNYVISENGINAKCVRYRIEMDEAFLVEILQYSIDAIMENDNLTGFLGDEVVDLLSMLKDESNDYTASGSDDRMIMDVFVQDNVIIRRDISFYADNEHASVSITEVSDKYMGYLAIDLLSDEGDIYLVNNYTKVGKLMNGTMTLSFDGMSDYTLGGDFLTVAYTDVYFDDVYGFTGSFQFSIPSVSLDIYGLSFIKDEYTFSYNFELAGQPLMSLSGYTKITDGYTDINMPDMSGFEQVDIYDTESYYEITENLTYEITEFFYNNFEENFADENGNLDIIGTAIAAFLIPFIVSV